MTQPLLILSPVFGANIATAFECLQCLWLDAMMKHMSRLFVTLILAATCHLSAAEPSKIIVTEFAYYMNGDRSEGYEAHRQHLHAHREKGVSVFACSRANVERLVEFMEWLKVLGMSSIEFSAGGDDKQPLCRER